MRTSTARANEYRCPKCGDETTRDEAGIGYVRHLRNPSCDFEKGERDQIEAPETGSWHTTENRDNGSLSTGPVRLEVGDTIEIRGEGKRRRVTYVMGSPNKWHATFKGQGAVPEGKVEWKLIARPRETPRELHRTDRSTPSPPLPPSSEGRLHTAKLVLEIMALLITVIGGAVAIYWQLK